jgi:hypothetical protein
MASATCGSLAAVRAVSAAGRRRGDLRAVGGGRRGAAAESRRARRGAPSPARRAFLRGVAASGLIACGYAAIVTALRALLSFA